MTPRTRRMATLYAALLLVAVFLAGAAGGFFAGRATAPRPDAGPPVPPDGLGPPPLRRLNLTLEQQAKAREIGERYRPALEALRQQIRPEAEKLHRKMRAELRRILTPEQRELHDRLEREQMPPPHGPPSRHARPPPHGPPPPFPG